MSSSVSIQPIGAHAKWFSLDGLSLFRSGIDYYGTVSFAFESAHTQQEQAAVEILKLYLTFKEQTELRPRHQALMALCKSMRAHQVHNIKFIAGLDFLI